MDDFMKKWFPVFAFLLSPLAIADNCDKPRDDFDGLYCLNKIYIEADKELNESYKALRAYLNDAEKQQLKKTQIAWIKERNSSCSLRQDGMFFVSLGCTTKTTVDRTNTLKDRIRECKATGCQASKL